MTTLARSGDWMEVGYVARAHGVRGEIFIFVYGSALPEVGCLRIEGREWPVLAMRRHRHHDRVLVRVSGIEDRKGAEKLRGKPVFARRSDLVVEGETLLADLIGLTAVLKTGRVWGEIIAVDAGVQDRLVVVSGNREWLLPVVDAFVGAIDTDAKTVLVFPPPGLPEQARDR